jgi:hypothetical protein
MYVYIYINKKTLITFHTVSIYIFVFQPCIYEFMNLYINMYMYANIHTYFYIFNTYTYAHR